MMLRFSFFKSFILRFITFSFPFVFYILFIYSTSTNYDFWSEQHQKIFMAIVELTIVSLALYLYAEMKRFFDDNQENVSKHRKIFFTITKVWAILFIVLNIIHFLSL